MYESCAECFKDRGCSEEASPASYSKDSNNNDMEHLCRSRSLPASVVQFGGGSPPCVSIVRTGARRSEQRDGLASSVWPQTCYEHVRSGLWMSHDQPCRPAQQSCDENGNIVKAESRHNIRACEKSDSALIDQHRVLYQQPRYEVPSCVSNREDILLKSPMKKLSNSSNSQSFKGLCLSPSADGQKMVTVDAECCEITSRNQQLYGANSNKIHRVHKPLFSSTMADQQKAAPDKNSTMTISQERNELKPCCVASVNIALLGDYGVGKSQLLQAFNRTVQREKTDVQCKTFRDKEMLEMIVNKEGRKMRVRIMDTAGQERYRSLTSSYFRGVHGCFLVFDLAQRETFDSVIHWHNDMQRYSEVSTAILLGIALSSQTREAREVTSESAFRMAENMGTQYLETTLEDGEMLGWVLERMVEGVSRALPSGVDPAELVTIRPCPAQRDRSLGRKLPTCAS